MSFPDGILSDLLASYGLTIQQISDLAVATATQYGKALRTAQMVVQVPTPSVDFMFAGVPIKFYDTPSPTFVVYFPAVLPPDIQVMILHDIPPVVPIVPLTERSIEELVGAYGLGAIQVSQAVADIIYKDPVIGQNPSEVITLQFPYPTVRTDVGYVPIKFVGVLAEPRLVLQTPHVPPIDDSFQTVRVIGESANI